MRSVHAPARIATAIAIAIATAAALTLVPARAQSGAPEPGAAANAANATPTTGAAAAPPVATAPSRLSVGIYGGLGYLGINDVNGGAFLAGVRLALGRYGAFSFDLGYGVLSVTRSIAVQDRWWLMPSVALVVPVGPARIDLGVGFGLGSASGYESWPAYVAAPFDPVWAFQMVPAVRLHAEVLVPVSTRDSLFARLETALLLGPGKVGFREGDADRPLSDITWTAVWLGAHYRAL